MGTIYFVRHGQASFGERNYDSLCENGKLQSRILGEYLADCGFSFDAAYSGEMERQKQTAFEVISVFDEKRIEFPGLKILSEFNEFDFFKIVMIFLPDMIKEDPSFKDDVDKMYNDIKAFQRIIDTVLTGWMAGKYERQGMMGWKKFKERIMKGIDWITNKNDSGKNIIVFSSGGPISALMQIALGISDQMTAKLCWQINNASITRFLYNSGGITLAGFNNISHLEIKNDRGLITYR